MTVAIVGGLVDRLRVTLALYGEDLDAAMLTNPDARFDPTLPVPHQCPRVIEGLCASAETGPNKAELAAPVRRPRARPKTG